MSMTPRLNPFAAAPAAMKALLDFGNTVLQCGLETSLMELVKIRASQINGCARCLHMHTAEARQQWRIRRTALSARCLARIAAL
jgi:AhpD family alkylhydroperoxidase